MEQQIVNLDEVIVEPTKLIDRILGNQFKGKRIQGGFRENNKGFECGVLLKIEKKAYLEELICNIVSCTYDSVFYRVNVYKQEEGKNNFTNILNHPIYISEKITGKQKTLSIDLRRYNIIVEGNTLVTLEHLIDMGEGHLLFSGGMLKGSNCYYRKRSQGYWEKIPINLSFSVKAKVEK